MESISQLFLKRGYTVFAFDLYFHGKSSWEDVKEPILLENWKAIMSLFFQQEAIDKIELLSYSLGSKFTLPTLHHYSEKVKHVYLIAPDSVVLRNTYRLATSTMIGRALFKSLTSYSNSYRKLINLIRTLRLADKSTIRFAEKQIQSREQGLKVYYSWTVFRKLYIPFQQLAVLLNQKEIGLYVLLGRYDRIVNCKQVTKKLRQVKNRSVSVVQLGHTKLIEQFVEENS